MKKETKEYKEFLNDEPFFKRDYEQNAQYARQCMQRCPICGMYAPFITNVHCVKEHGMTKKEIEAVHGKIIAEGSKKYAETRLLLQS